MPLNSWAHNYKLQSKDRGTIFSQVYSYIESPNPKNSKYSHTPSTENLNLRPQPQNPKTPNPEPP